VPAYSLDDNYLKSYYDLTGHYLNDSLIKGLEKEIADFVSVNYRLYLPGGKASSTISSSNIYAHLFENYLLGERLFLRGNSYRRHRENYLYYTRLTMLKNLKLYLGDVQKNDLNNDQLLTYLRILFINGSLTSNLFMLYEFIADSGMNIGKAGIIKWIFDRNEELYRSSQSPEIRQFLNVAGYLVSIVREKLEVLDQSILSAIVEHTKKTSFENFGLYFEVILDAVSGRGIDIEKADLIENSLLRQDITIIQFCMDFGGKEIIIENTEKSLSIDLLNPLVRNTVVKFMGW